MEENVNMIYYNADDIAKKLGTSKSSAYGIIRKLNAELEKLGYLTIRGKVSRCYFDEKWYGGSA